MIECDHYNLHNNCTFCAYNFEALYFSIFNFLHLFDLVNSYFASSYYSALNGMTSDDQCCGHWDHSVVATNREIKLDQIQSTTFINIFILSVISFSCFHFGLCQRRLANHIVLFMLDTASQPFGNLGCKYSICQSLHSLILTVSSSMPFENSMIMWMHSFFN